MTNPSLYLNEFNDHVKNTTTIKIRHAGADFVYPPLFEPRTEVREFCCIPMCSRQAGERKRRVLLGQGRRYLSVGDVGGGVD